MSSTISGLPAYSGTPSGLDVLPVVKVSDTTTPPAGPGGHDAKLTLSELGLMISGLVNVVRDDQADPTGTGEARSAFQSAVNSLSAFGGGTVLVPPGTFKLTPYSATVPAVTVPSNVTIAGMGRGATTLAKGGNGIMLDYSGPGPAALVPTINEHQGLRDICLDGGGYTGLLLRLYYVQNYYEHDVLMQNNADVFVDAAEWWDSRVTNGEYLYGGSASASAVSGAQAVVHLIRNSAAPATTLSAGVSGTVTALPVAALPAAMPAGIVQVWNAAGQVQNFTTTGAASAATSIPVTSVAVAYTFVTGDTVNGFGWSDDNSNADTFTGCHWENNLSGAIWVTSGVDNTAQTNQIKFLASKCEQDQIGYNCPQIQVDSNCANISFDGLYFYAGAFNSGYSTAVTGIQFHPITGRIANVDMLNGSVATISTGIDSASSSPFNNELSHVYQYWTTAPTSGNGVNCSAGSTFVDDLQILGSFTGTGLAGTYSLLNDVNGDWSFPGTGSIGPLNSYAAHYFNAQSAPAAQAGFAGVYADSNGTISNIGPSGLTSRLQQSQYAATSAVTVASTNAIASLGSLSVPAGDPVAGAVYRFKLPCVMSIASAATATTYVCDVRWGGTGGTLLTSLHSTATANSPLLPNSTALANVPVLIDGEIEFRTATTVVGWLRMTWTNSTTAATAATVSLAVISSPVTVSTAGAEALSVDWTWGTNSASNTITAETSVFERAA